MALHSICSAHRSRRVVGCRADRPEAGPGVESREWRGSGYRRAARPREPCDWRLVRRRSDCAARRLGVQPGHRQMVTFGSAAAGAERVPVASDVERLITVDSEHNAAMLGGDHVWTRLPEVPLRFFEGGIDIAVVSETWVARGASRFAIWDTASEAWLPLAYPDRAATVWTIGGGGCDPSPYRRVVRPFHS